MLVSHVVYTHFFSIPKLNIAIPSPPSDNIAMELATIAGSLTPHLQSRQAFCLMHVFCLGKKNIYSQRVNPFHGEKIGSPASSYLKTISAQMKPAKHE